MSYTPPFSLWLIEPHLCLTPKDPPPPPQHTHQSIVGSLALKLAQRHKLYNVTTHRLTRLVPERIVICIQHFLYNHIIIIIVTMALDPDLFAYQ